MSCHNHIATTFLDLRCGISDIDIDTCHAPWKLGPPSVALTTAVIKKKSQRSVLGLPDHVAQWRSSFDGYEEVSTAFWEPSASGGHLGRRIETPKSQCTLKSYLLRLNRPSMARLSSKVQHIPTLSHCYNYRSNSNSRSLIASTTSPKRVITRPKQIHC